MIGECDFQVAAIGDDRLDLLREKCGDLAEDQRVFVFGGSYNVLVGWWGELIENVGAGFAPDEAAGSAQRNEASERFRTAG